MRRRAILRASVGTLALASSPAVAASRVRRSAGRGGVQNGYGPIGRVEVDGAAEAVVAGDVAYVAATTGFATVDVSDPANPAVLAEEHDLEVDGEPVSDVLDVAVDGDRLAVAGPANRRRADVPTFHGLLVFDVSDPADPELVGDPYETGFHIHNCALSDERLFVVRNEPSTTALVIYDVADGVEEVGRWSLLDAEPDWSDVHWQVRYLHDVTVHDDVAYLPHWDAGTVLLDVSDPADPESIVRIASTTPEDHGDADVENRRLGLPGNDHYATVDESGDLLGIGREAWVPDAAADRNSSGDDASGDGGDAARPGGIDFYDVSDPADPEHLSSIDALRAAEEHHRDGLWTTAHNFELRDGDCYSAWYRAGVAIHDVSDPTDPRERARWRDPARAGFWTARVVDSGSVFVASSTSAIPNAPTEGALYAFPIEDGTQADPPSLTDPAEYDLASEDETTDDQATEVTTDDDQASGTDETVAGDDGGSFDPTPGFTATGTAVAGAGAVVLERLRRAGRRD